MQDQFQRKIEYLRVSVTDCCNLRCRYCMPEHGVKKLRHADVLTYEEILRDVRALAELGVRKVRLTAEGFLKLCLYSNAGLDTRALLRGGMSDAQLADAIAHAVWKKPEEHHFDIDQETRDHRAMYQVGG